MKRILISLLSVFALSLAISCEKAEPATPDTTYTITMAMSSVTSSSTNGLPLEQDRGKWWKILKEHYP